MSDTYADTTEQDHPHTCPVCADTWLHACAECEPVYGEHRPSYAVCPIHEEESR